MENLAQEAAQMIAKLHFSQLLKHLQAEGRIEPQPELYLLVEHEQLCMRRVGPDKCNCVATIVCCVAESDTQWLLDNTVVEYGFRVQHVFAVDAGKRSYPSAQTNLACACYLRNPLSVMFCPYGHLTECHYPCTCEQAECGHWEQAQKEVA